MRSNDAVTPAISMLDAVILKRSLACWAHGRSVSSPGCCEPVIPEYKMLRKRSIVTVYEGISPKRNAFDADLSG